MKWVNLFAALQPFSAIGLPLALIAIGFLFEALAPAGATQRPRHKLLNITHTIFIGWLKIVLEPVLGIAVTMLINTCGGGWIALAGAGWALIPSAIAYLLVIDFLEFAFHRAQHAVPFLWAMHSFHHSDSAVNVSTATRNYWLELPIKALFVYPFAAILFRVPTTILAIYVISSVWHAVNHLNLRWGIPLPWYVINNPQFHRIHHSVLPEHRDKNFAAYFPLWDLIGGTAYVPKRNEYPPTGLAEEQGPISFADALLWPWRRHFRGQGSTPAAPV